MKLKELRINRNLSQEEYGKLVGITQSSCNNYENEKTQPKFETLIKMADLENVSLDYLLDKKWKNSTANLTEKQKELLPFIETLNKDKVMQAKGYLERLNQEN